MNLQDFENQGWTQMREMLDREMPIQKTEKRKKRFLIWWQFAGFALLLSLFIYGFISKTFFYNNEKKIQNNNIANKKFQNADTLLPFIFSNKIQKENIFNQIDNQRFIKKLVAKQARTEGGIAALKKYINATKQSIETNKEALTDKNVFFLNKNFQSIKSLIETQTEAIAANNQTSKEKNKIAENIDSELVSFLPLLSGEIKMEKSKLNITFASPLQPLKQPAKTLPSTNWAVFVASNASLFSPFNAALGVQYRLPLRAKNWEFWAGVSCWATSKTAESWVYLHPSEVAAAVSSTTTTTSVLPLMPLEELQLTHLFYATIPFNAQYNFSNTFLKKMYIDLNFKTSYLFSQRLENKETGVAKYALSTQGGSRTLTDPLSNMSNNTQVLPKNFVAQDLGLNTWDFSAGIGVGYRLGANWSASMQYQHGLNNILTTSFSTHYTHFWQLKLKKEF